MDETAYSFMGIARKGKAPIYCCTRDIQSVCVDLSMNSCNSPTIVRKRTNSLLHRIWALSPITLIISSKFKVVMHFIGREKAVTIQDHFYPPGPGVYYIVLSMYVLTLLFPYNCG